MSPLSIVFPAVMLLAVIASQLGAGGALRRNHWFGVRVPAALANDAAWVAAHRASILPSWVGFVVCAALGAAAWWEPASWNNALKYVLAAAFVLAIVVILVTAQRAARGADR